ncbi:hypothetical protein [Streptomyces sp. CBMAI 2042]|uniref:hypothetical protein n=1 Tax=Streptomyces sp. CBMAI 2042 TaxID=2305222 RepID=UPI001F2D55A3|nr:hypothetical protein [Streptomyces sp. CBMAI 2042]
MTEFETHPGFLGGVDVAVAVECIRVQTEKFVAKMTDKTSFRRLGGQWHSQSL